MGYYEDLECLTDALVGDLLEEYRRWTETENELADEAENYRYATAALVHEIAGDAYARAATALRRVLNKRAPGKKTFSIPGDW